MNIELIDLNPINISINDSNKDLIFNAKYGDGQPAQVSRVKLSEASSNILIRQTINSISEDEFNLGNGGTIKGQVLSVKTYLGDSSPFTNQVSVTYSFTNGADLITIEPYSYTVESNDSVVLRIRFFLQ